MVEYSKKKDDKAEAKPVGHLIMSTQEIEKPSDKYAPEGFATVEDYLADVRETHALDLEADHDNREAALEDKQFTFVDMWDPIVRQQRAGLPCLEINSVKQFVAQLVGDWRTNRSAVKVIPAENGDKEVASIRSDLIRSIETDSRATTVYNNAFESMVVCGDGAFRVDVKYASEDVFDQKIEINPIDDALSVVWDRLSIDTTGRDARHCFVDDVIPEKEFKTQFGEEADPSNLNDRQMKMMRSTGWCDHGTVRVTEHWRIIERLKRLVLFEDGAMLHVGDDQAELIALSQEHGMPVKSRIAPCRYAQMHLITGYKILAGPYEWKLNRLPIIRMAGRTGSVGEKRVRYGLVRDMKDPARLRNFWRSIAAEQLGYAPKAQWMATEEAVGGREDTIRKAHQSRDPLLIFNDEARFGENVQRVDPPQLQMALLNEAQINTQDMKDVTGIHDASLGIKSNETSGRAIMARQREGDIASLTYYDNGNASILEAGDVINQFIPQIYDATRVVRIIGEDEATKLVKINDPMDPNSPNLAVGKYDVAITTGASYTTRRVEAAEAMMEAVQVFPQMMEIAGDLVAKAQDWPGAEELAERLKKTVPPQLLSEKERSEMEDQPDMQAIMQQQAQMQEAMQKGMEELQKLKEDNLKLSINAEAKAKELEIREFEAETKRMEAIASIAEKDEEFRLREIEHDAQMENQEAEREVKREGIKNKASAPSAKPSSKKP